MNFFCFCKTHEEAKKRYRELVKKHHPDAGGDPVIMAKINEQYDKFKPQGENFKSTFEGTSRPNGQTAGWRTNKPHTKHEGYGDIPFDHPIRQELFQLRNRLAQCDNTYTRPRTPREDNEIVQLRKDVAFWKDLNEMNATVVKQKEIQIQEMKNEMKHMWKHEDVTDYRREVIESEKLKFKQMSFFAKISYLFFPDSV